MIFTLKLIFLFVLSYVAGSVNFSILVCRLSGLTDPRENGSNNPGATALDYPLPTMLES